MIDLNLTISIIILNVNGLHTPIKKQRLAEESFKKKKKSCPCTMCFLQETHFTHNDRAKLKVKRYVTYI